MRDASDSIPGLADRRVFFTAKNRFGSPFRGRRTAQKRKQDKLQQLKQDELKQIFNSAFLDREQAEVVSLTESRLLDVDRGEVLRNSRYIRTFTL